ncbi:hypothetical protein UlMin_013335 [Ulmus minor]
MENKKQRRSRLILVPCPYQGHINPMLQLGSILHTKGFSITIAHTKYNSPKSQNHPDFSFFPLPDGLSDGGELVDELLAINENCEEPLQKFLEQLREKQEQQQEEISCIISDELLFFCEAVAINMKLPSIILRTTSASTSFARSGLARLTAEGLVSSHDSLSTEVVPNLHPLRFKDLPLSLTSDFGKFSVIVAKTYTNRMSSAIIWNTTDCLENSTLEIIKQQCQAPIFPIGPIHKLATASISCSLIKEDRSCISWLDKQLHHSVIYVSSFGSLASLGEKEVAEIAWGLANSNQPFLWVIRPGSIRGSDWIELLPRGFQNAVGDRGCVVKWVPQREVLAHEAVGGFWSHCGWNSTLESIAEGVPIICYPCFGDQLVNARYISYVWRVGLELEELERGEIERAVRKLILDNEGKEMRERAQELKEKVEVCTRKNGTSHNSLNELVKLIMSL